MAYLSAACISRVCRLIREYVALEKVEGVYALNPLFSTLLVHGDGLQSHIILIGICDPVQSAALIQRVTGEKVDPTDLNKIKSLINDKRVRRQVLRDLKKLSQKAGLTGYVEDIGSNAIADDADHDSTALGSRRSRVCTWRSTLSQSTSSRPP